MRKQRKNVLVKHMQTATLALAVDSARADKGVAERRRGKVVKAERKQQSKVRSLEKKLEEEHDKTEALLRKADNTPKRSPKKRVRVGSPDSHANVGISRPSNAQKNPASSFRRRTDRSAHSHHIEVTTKACVRPVGCYFFGATS